MGRLLNLLNPGYWRFEWRYWRRQTPWNTGITPPEVMRFIEGTPPGRALDLGCGTGTNALALAQCGWEVVGIDFSVQAIHAARRKAAALELPVDFQAHDVTDLGFLDPPFDYALDIGCLFNMKPEQQESYAQGLARLMAPSGRYMLYAWLPQTRNGRQVGMSQQAVDNLLQPHFDLDAMTRGKDGGGPSAWYWLTRK